MAIPPTDPVIFITGCDERGLYVRWALELTEATATMSSGTGMPKASLPISI
jgi:hypothetical protein